MQAVIFAGGYGTRIAEKTEHRPKPMVEVGGQPILWHIMKIYSKFGVSDFVILGGYKANVIKEYFVNYCYSQSDIRVDFQAKKVEVLNASLEPWRVTVLDTGDGTMTGGRLRRAADFLDDRFFLTYGDAVADINISDLLAFHNSHSGLVTLTAVKPEARFGALSINEAKVTEFREKLHSDEGTINGGFFVCDKAAIDTIEGDQTIWERAPLGQLASEGQLYAYNHEGFWAPMDTLRDQEKLERLWNSGEAPWKIW